MPLEALLDFESRGEVLDFKFSTDGVLMWPFARWGLFLQALAAEHGFLAPVHRSPRGPGRVLRYLLRSFIENPLRTRRRFDIAVFGSTTGVVVRREGGWFGRINDYFVLSEEDRTLVLDQSQDFAFRRPRVPRHAGSHDWIKLRAEAGRRLSGTPAADVREIGRLAGFLRERFPRPLEEAAWARLTESLTKLAGRLPFLERGYRKLFERITPRVAFVEDASYGSEAYLMKWAKDLGIKTAEFQHGVIVPTHHAYNFGEGLHRSAEYRRHLPDFLLTHGRFWSDNARTPSEKVVIGCPHFTESVRGRPRSAAAKSLPVVLIVSQPDVAGELTRLAADFSEALGGAGRIIYRLHPAEVPHRERYRALEGRENLALSDSGDIFDLIAEADCVAGSSSTALFEAAGFGLPVLVHEDPSSALYIPRSFGTRFRTAAELAALVKAPPARSEDPEGFWAPGWQANYRRFLAEKVFGEAA